MAQVAVCVEPSSVCEIAWALGLPTVMVVDGRLEKGREQPSHWQRFVTSLRSVVKTQGGGGWGADMLVVATSAYVPLKASYTIGSRPHTLVAAYTNMMVLAAYVPVPLQPFFYQHLIW